MKTHRIHRLLRLITLLQAGTAYQALDLAEKLKVSRRTLFRDLDLLRLAGIPLKYITKDRRYIIEKGFFLPPVNFTIPEVLGLMMILGKLAPKTALPHARDIVGAMMKIESTLPPDIQAYCGSVLSKISFKTPPATDADHTRALFDRLLRACEKHEILEVLYDSYFEKKEIETRIRPYQLMSFPRGWYLIGYSEKHKETRTFKVDRIIQAKPTGKQFRMTQPFDPVEYFGNAWGMIRGDKRYHVKIRFSPKVAGNVEEVLWHPTQHIEYLDDGSIRFEVKVDGVDEIAWWILGYGKEAIVEKPAKLRHIIRDHAKAMADNYQRS